MGLFAMKLDSKLGTINLDTAVNSERATRDGSRRATLSPNCHNYSAKKMVLPFQPSLLPARLLAALVLNDMHGESCFKRVFIESRRTRIAFSERIILQAAIT